MQRSHDVWDWAGHIVRDTNINYPTGYSELYSRVHPACQHQWSMSSNRSSGSLFRGRGVGCGSQYSVLNGSHDLLLRRLTYLDEAEIPAILATLPLYDEPSATVQKQMDVTFAALEKLPSQPTKQATQQWWQKNRHLFE